MRNIRNVAVIAHVDHGKTTLIDALLKQTHLFRENEEEMSMERILDSNDLERERGITILAKNCAINYKDIKINIIDTPGHADFSGEVERTLSMADGALLIVDAQEGPMPQTRFVLKKALELDLKIIVVINKIDKKFARISEVRSRIESLFLDLAKNDSQIDFPVLYAIGRNGYVFDEIPEGDIEGTAIPLLEKIINYIQEPQGEVNDIFKMQVSNIEYDDHLGRIAVGKILKGEVMQGQKIIIAPNDSKIFTAEKLFLSDGLGRISVEGASAGDIVYISGISEITIGDTLSDPKDNIPLSELVISEPTLKITLGPNTSPFSGKEGKYSTSRQISERLQKELEKNLSLRVEFLENGKFRLAGKGELHLAILLETMRREGYEMEVGKPEVITKNIDEKECEPIEEVYVIVPSEFCGAINQEFGKRLALIEKMENINEHETEFVFHAPTRALIGIRSQLLTLTKGTSIYSSVLYGYEPIGKSIPKLRKGALIAAVSGKVMAYGLDIAQGRGVTFVEPGDDVYEGEVIGLNAKDDDISINVCKGKKLTNMRSKASDGIIQLSPALVMSIEQSLDFIEKDELLEITPLSLRIRKKHLTELERRRNVNSSEGVYYASV